MKKWTTIVLAFVCGNVFAQKADITKNWVGNDLEYITVNSELAILQVFGKYLEEKKYYLLDDTLRLYDKYTHSKDNYAKEHIKNYDFLIKDLTDTSMTLVPIDDNALAIVGGKRTIAFRERHLAKQPSIAFELIRFRSTTCYGTCPSMTLQIDKEKQLLFMGGLYAVKQGLHTATLSDSLFQSLLEILQLSELDKLKTWPQKVFDAPEYTLEVHYNKKIIYLKNYELPFVTRELVNYLLDIPKKVELITATTSFDINFTAPPENVAAH